MKIKHVLILLLAVFTLTKLNAQTSWYVDQNTGSDINTGMTPGDAFKSGEYASEEWVSPSDTVFIIREYRNESYIPGYTFSGDINDPHIWMF